MSKVYIYFVVHVYLKPVYFHVSFGMFLFFNACSNFCGWIIRIFIIEQIVAESQKRGENALTEKREKVMLELDKLQR